MVFGERSDAGKPKNFHKSHMHNKSFQPMTTSSLSTQSDNVKGYHGKVQHFKYGATSGGSTSNKMLYGSLEPFDLDMSTIKPKQQQQQQTVRKYYQTPDAFRYGQNDFSSHYNGKKISNVFSLEERSSAELRKKQREVQQIEREYACYLQDKENQLKNIEAEKRKEHDILKSYKAPWGKAGGGAPNESHVRTQQIYKLIDDKEQTFPFGRPGAGAPLKTNSGNLKTGLPADPEIRFQKRDRNQIYDVIGPEGKLDRSNPLATELDILAHETRERRNVLKRNQDMSMSIYDPFGRPGAGAPLRDDKGGTKAARSMNLVKTVAGQDTANNHLIDTSLQYGTPRFKKPLQENFQGLGFGRGGGGAPITDPNGYVITSKKQTLVSSGNGAVVKTNANESFDNRGGGGAPLRDEHGNLITQVGGKWQVDNLAISKQKGETIAKKKYLESLRIQAEQHQKLKQNERLELQKPSTDTTSWLKQGRVGKPTIDDDTNEIVGARRVTSDIVKQRLEMNHRDKSKEREYHEQLEKHSKLLEETRQEQTSQQREKSVEHARTMDTVWGKPGCGAPNTTPRRRKLDVVLT